MNVIALRQVDRPIFAYLGKVNGALHDFDELLPLVDTPAHELEQRSIFFILALYGFPSDYFTICDHILGSPNVRSLTIAWFALLRVLTKPSAGLGLPPVPIDACALVSEDGGLGRT